MKETISCLISLYNEGERIFTVLDSLKQLSNLDETIVVDDGSTVNYSQEIKERYPRVNFLRFEKNHGKSGAVFEGLKVVSSDNVLLFDADLYDINIPHLKTAIDYFLNHQETDMVILKRMHDPLFNRLIRTNIVISGQRLLRTKDLREIFKTKFANFQLELAINDYMIKNKKRVSWLPFSCYDPRKIQKFGFIRGAIKELKMTADLFSFKGPWYFFHCLFTFATEKLE